MAKTKREIQPNEIKWVFCWRTCTGEVGPGAREVFMPGRPISVRPASPNNGLRTIVRGPGRTRPRSVVGPRLDQQGAMSRAGIHALGYVTRANLVPARSEEDLTVLCAAARAAILSGAASEWALAAIHARGRVHPAVHVGGDAAVVAGIAASVGAQWVLQVRERIVDSRVDGSEVVWVDVHGVVVATLAADTLFDDAPVPHVPVPTAPSL